MVLPVLLTAGVLQAQPTPASSPSPAPTAALRVSPADADAITGLARSAMKEYLARRTPADKQEMPKSAAALADLDLPAAVRLRRGPGDDGGELLIQQVADGGKLGRNIIQAALLAMRSPKLPDKVTPAVLDGLTVEVEVLSAPAAVQPAAIAQQYIQGFTGLKLVAKDQIGYALPSSGYEDGASALQMMTQCKSQAGIIGAGDQGGQWHTLTSWHFISYGGAARGVWLFRGKLLTPAGSVKPADLLSGAHGAADYLIRHQTKEGCFTAGRDKALLGEHLYAVYAIARLSAADSRHAPHVLSKPLAYARSLLKHADQQAYLASESPADQLLAAGMYILATSAAGEKADKAREELVASIYAAMGDSAILPAQLDGTAKPKAGNRDSFIAYKALREATAADSPQAAKLATLGKLLRATSPLTAQEWLWKCWAGLEDPAAIPPAKLAATAAGENALVDEEGGFAPSAAETPQTLLTALKALQLAAQLAKPAGPDAATSRPSTSAPTAATSSPSSAADDIALLDARGFCWRMLYRSGEAFFAADPADWTGAVRLGPAGAAVGVWPAAAAIEALTPASKMVSKTGE